MPWLNLSDDYVDKLAEAGVSDAAFRLHVTAMSMSNRLGTDGLMSPRMTKQAGADLDGDTACVVRELVERGLWVDAERGHVIAGFLDREGPYALHQMSRADREARQESNRQRQERHRQRQRESRVTGGVTNATTNAATNGAHTSPRHSPPRSGVGEGTRATDAPGPRPVCPEHHQQYDPGRLCPLCEADRKAAVSA